MDFIESKASGTVCPRQGKNARIPYEHQKAAMNALSKIDKSQKTFSGLIVLPTGGGKTYTAATWLLKNAVDKEKKVLWIAHRQFLLDQAANAFQDYAYAIQMPHVSSFTYRIISGSTRHDRMIDIKPTDNIIIASKDSIARDLKSLNKWLKGEDELYLVIDEAHHATAKTYRLIINYLKKKVQGLKIIGLTATPFRTEDSEQGLLKMVFPDDIIYSISLKDLINRQILSRLEVEDYQTGEDFTKIAKNDKESIIRMDTIPQDIADELISSKERNHLIVETYKKNQNKYGQTIVFTVSINHAVTLAKLFRKNGIKADYVVSAIRDAGTGATIAQQENDKKLEEYRSGKLQVLVNVEILTEGVDLPQTKTVFLTRPTVSKTLMTQMVGRALRGVRAGGTEIAYAVSFIDNWNISFVSPDSLIEDETATFEDRETEREKREVRLISISKIEEFASLLDDTVDTTALESLPFVQRIPIGMYSFVCLGKDTPDISYQIMIYNSNQESYHSFFEMVPSLFKNIDNNDEYLPEETINEMEQVVYDACFKNIEFPEYDPDDVKHVIEYYAQKDSLPEFYSFADIDRNKLDVSQIAEKIFETNMPPKEEADYVNKLWDDGENDILRIFFGRKIYFIKQVEIEIEKKKYPDLFEANENITYEKKKLEDLPLAEIKRINPAAEKILRDSAFARSRDKYGFYHCAKCGKTGRTRKGFQVDHIKPMNKGGKSIPSNLQILCSSCNGKKGDH